ncbi:MAG: acyl carrier protein [Lacunisphaera sp.]
MHQAEALLWIADLFQENPESLNVDTPRTAIRDWDSLGVLTLMAALDEKFAVVVSDDDTRAMQKVGDIIELLRQKGKVL